MHLIASSGRVKSLSHHYFKTGIQRSLKRRPPAAKHCAATLAKNVHPPLSYRLCHHLIRRIGAVAEAASVYSAYSSHYNKYLESKACNNKVSSASCEYDVTPVGVQVVSRFTVILGQTLCFPFPRALPSSQRLPFMCPCPVHG